jgi:hypothetical protein
VGIAGRWPTPRQLRWGAIRSRAQTTATAPRACSAPQDSAEAWGEAGLVGASRARYAWWTRRTRSTIRWVGAGRIPLLNLLSLPMSAQCGPYQLVKRVFVPLVREYSICTGSVGVNPPVLHSVLNTVCSRHIST